MNELIIGRPYITETEGKARLCSMITGAEAPYEMWFEVDTPYKPYLCTERADAFVLALLFYCLKHGCNLRSETAVSKQLYYKLTFEYIPTLGNHTEAFQPFQILAPVTSEKLSCAGAVGTGASGGVDSFFSILKHHNMAPEMADYELTHLTFFNTGSHGDFGGEEARKLFVERQKRAQQLADALKLPLVSVDTNLSEFIQMPFLPTASIRNLSAVLALQKLFARYYFSSGEPVFCFRLDATENDNYDLLNTYAVSTENTTVHNSGLAETRLEKIRYIAQFPITYRYLNICITGDENCGKCDKCVRTMNALYAIDQLDHYSEVFDLEDYYSHLAERLGYSIDRASDATYAQQNHKEALEALTEAGKSIPNAAVEYARILKRNREKEHIIRMVKGKLKAIKNKRV